MYEIYKTSNIISKAVNMVSYVCCTNTNSFQVVLINLLLCSVKLGYPGFYQIILLGSEQNLAETGHVKTTAGGDFFDYRKSRGAHFFCDEKITGRILFLKKNHGARTF